MKYTSTLIAVSDMEKSKQFYHDVLGLSICRRLWHIHYPGRRTRAADPRYIPYPALLICGEKDRAGSTVRYNKAWHEKTGIPLEWIQDAGHNANTDKPEVVNALIKSFVKTITED